MSTVAEQKVLILNRVIGNDGGSFDVLFDFNGLCVARRVTLAGPFDEGVARDLVNDMLDHGPNMNGYDLKPTIRWGGEMWRMDLSTGTITEFRDYGQHVVATWATIPQESHPPKPTSVSVATSQGWVGKADADLQVVASTGVRSTI